MEKVMDISPKLESVVKQKEFKFQVPTKVTKLDPIFFFRFYTQSNQIGKKDITFDIILNSTLNNSNEIVKQSFICNEKGMCKINYTAILGYFIEGDIEYYIDTFNNKCCAMSITYGNSTEAMHYIKGKFKLQN